jgi:hypothetical protein
MKRTMKKKKKNHLEVFARCGQIHCGVKRNLLKLRQSPMKELEEAAEKVMV